LSTQLKSLIPDAMVIIRLHEMGLWEELCDQTAVVVPSTIVHESVFYVEPSSRERVEIELESQVLEGEISQVTATAEDMAQFMTQFDAVMVENLHPGEVEALTLMHKGRVTDALFCSADQAAVKALVLVGMNDRGISLEDALKATGLRGAGRVGEQYCRARFTQWVREAVLDRLQGRGLARDPF